MRVRARARVRAAVALVSARVRVRGERAAATFVRGRTGVLFATFVRDWLGRAWALPIWIGALFVAVARD